MKPILLMLIIAGLAAGCAHQTRDAATRLSSAASRPSVRDSHANLTLDEVPDRPVLSAPRLVVGRAPVAALVLFARGTDLLLKDRAEEAVRFLNDAIKLDPHSFDLYYTLGRAQMQRFHGPTPDALDAFEHAADLHPNDLAIHLMLGRQYLASGDDAKAIRHLRLARQTTDYSADAPAGAAIELFLAHILEEEGYDRAALEEFTTLTERLKNPAMAMAMENDDDASVIAAEPDLIWLEIGRLHEKHARYVQALDAYSRASEFDPFSWEAKANVVRLLLKVGRSQDATRKVSELVGQFPDDSDARALLRQVGDTIGKDNFIDLLKSFHDKDPRDHGVLFALADILSHDGKADEARALLESTAAAHPEDLRILQQLFHFHTARGDLLSATRLLVNHLARQPNSVHEVVSLFDELGRPTFKEPLTIDDLQNLEVAPSALAAKLFLLSRIAESSHRRALRRSSIEQATNLLPPFGPAFYAEVDDIWVRPDYSGDQRISASQALARIAGDAGDTALQAEILGYSLAARNQYNEAIPLFEKGMALGDSSPTAQLIHAAILLHLGKTARYEGLLRDLVSHYPMDDDAWNVLYAYLSTSDREADEIDLLDQWLSENPGSLDARIFLADWEGRKGRKQAAIQQLTDLLKDHGDDAGLLQRVASLYMQLTSRDDFLSLLQDLHGKQPTNMAVVDLLTEIFTQAKHLTDASQLLDETHKLVAKDPHRLYELAGLYDRIGQQKMKEQVLGEVLWLDSGHALASNDLGYAWADAGANLERAEQLIRHAVEAEPDNQAFLDSLGWVLYKRGKFADAEVYFERAINPTTMPDPEILDHFGDDLYRLGRAADARQKWQKSLERLGDQGSDDSETSNLRLEIQQKLHAAANGQPVNVAPVAAHDN